MTIVILLLKESAPESKPSGSAQLNASLTALELKLDTVAAASAGAIGTSGPTFKPSSSSNNYCGCDKRFNA